MVWCCLPSASGTGWKDHTKNMLCARCFLQDVRFDRNGKRLAVGVQVSKEDKKGRGAATYQIQESHLHGVVWDREMISSLLRGVQQNQQIHWTHTQHYRDEDKRRAALQFLCGNDKTDKYQSDLCHKVGFNVSLLQHDSTASTGTGTQFPGLASYEEWSWHAPGCCAAGAAPST